MESPMQQLTMAESASELRRLQLKLSVEFPHIERAGTFARLFREKLEVGLSGLTSSDVSIVVFGSLARDEFTEGSDVDWTALVDGVADPQHLDTTLRVKGVLESLGAKSPGREGIFGNMAFSHEIIHQIGGQDDTNSNTTKRILLILESRPIGRREAFDGVLNHVLNRYIAEDGRFLQKSAKFNVPRFLLNDFSRYWHTMAVDFAHKRRTRRGDGTAIRNIKLRMSRKLIFVSGLLACFSLHLITTEPERVALLDSAYPQHEFVRHMRRQLAQTPLEILASVINRYDHLNHVGMALFSAYDEFLGVLGDQEKREHLDKLSPGTEDGDPTFRQLRVASHSFRDALLDLFFDKSTGLADLTQTYGVF